MNIATAKDRFVDYSRRLQDGLATADWAAIETLGLALMACRQHRRQVFICGNGGSAANALHIANDFFYGMSHETAPPLRVQALSGNVSIVTCLANDEGYDMIFASQLSALADADDLLLVLSGSGNSPNIVKALETARQIGMTSFAILGYSGGKAKKLADHPIHFAIDDMQIAEDLQLIVGHMLMQWLCECDIAQG